MTRPVFAGPYQWSPCPGFLEKLIDLINSEGRGLEWLWQYGRFDVNQFYNGTFVEVFRVILRGVGEAALTPEFLGSLADTIRDNPNDFARGFALAALSELGPKSVTPEIYELAVELLNDRKVAIRATALTMLQETKSLTDCSEIRQALIGVIFLLGNILVIANWLAEKGVEQKANWLREEFLTGTAIAVILVLLILFVNPKVSSRTISFTRRYPVCDKRLIGNTNYCGECGKKV